MLERCHDHEDVQETVDEGIPFFMSIDHHCHASNTVEALCFHQRSVSPLLQAGRRSSRSRILHVFACFGHLGSTQIVLLSSDPGHVVSGRSREQFGHEVTSLGDNNYWNYTSSCSIQFTQRNPISIYALFDTRVRAITTVHPSIHQSQFYTAHLHALALQSPLL